MVWAGGSRRVGPKFRTFCSFSRRKSHSFFSLWGSSRGILVVFGSAGTLKPENSKRAHLRVPALSEHHQNSTRRPQRERVRFPTGEGTESAKFWAVQRRGGLGKVGPGKGGEGAVLGRGGLGGPVRRGGPAQVVLGGCGGVVRERGAGRSGGWWLGGGRTKNGRRRGPNFAEVGLAKVRLAKVGFDHPNTQPHPAKHTQPNTPSQTHPAKHTQPNTPSQTHPAKHPEPNTEPNTQPNTRQNTQQTTEPNTALVGL